MLKLFKFILLGAAKLMIYAYRLLSMQFYQPTCRFNPTCSQYALDAINAHGVYGLWLTFKRLIRCHPWGGSGYDPVPQDTAKSQDD